MLLAVLSATACTAAPYQSYVGGIEPSAVPRVAADMAALVRARIKPGDGAIQLEQPANDQTIGPVLLADLRDSGFTVVKSGGRHRVRYVASLLGSDIMTRISVDRADAARLYRDKIGVGLSPLGPFAVTEIQR
jgi:hypothetical protein